ncbi:MAG TPA: dihydroorotate dehydrogenase-like protein [Blastocatellia bacterium]|nr:dihydroorotate dehydrogenase-like protein [Blastocatellia bacterium]
MDLRTTYLGLDLRTPLVVSASPLSEELDNIRRMEDAGASAVVLYSLFEEELVHERRELEHYLTHGTESYAEALTYFPEPAQLHHEPEGYLDHIRRAKEAVDIPIIASLNGVSFGGWTSYSREIEQAGADALELNIYSIPTDMHLSGTWVEQSYLNILESVKSRVGIPVAVKLSPFFSNLANMAGWLDQAGANGLVLFNRFYQPDINPETLEVRPNIILSTPHALRLPMRWIAILYGRVKCSLAATSGIHTAQDVLKMLMAGASVTQLCSVLYRHGIGHIRVIERELREWMTGHEYESVTQLLGSMSQIHCANPGEFERAQYIRALHSFRPAQALKANGDQGAGK